MPRRLSVSFDSVAIRSDFAIRHRNRFNFFFLDCPLQGALFMVPGSWFQARLEKGVAPLCSDRFGFQTDASVAPVRGGTA